MLLKPSGEIFKNKIARIDGEFTKNGKTIKYQIRPDIWFWNEEADIKGLIPEKVLRLHLIEIKVPWGGMYKNESGGWTNTLTEGRRLAYSKYNKAIGAMQPYLKDKMNMARLTMERHIIVISSSDSLDKDCRIAIEKLLGTRTKSVIDIWCKRLVVAAIKGSHNIWLKRCGYKDIILKDNEYDPNEAVNKLEVFDGEQDGLKKERKPLKKA
jgi:hypothetical protein